MRLRPALMVFQYTDKMVKVLVALGTSLASLAPWHLSGLLISP